MQKLAQTRGILNKLKEHTDVSAIVAEKYFNKDFLKAMQDLRKADNDIRSIIVGKPIEGGTAGRDPASIKQLLKDTKTNLNRREYMAAIADLGRFHAKFIEVVNVINGLSHNVDKIHHDFLFKDLKEKHDRGEDKRFEHLRELKKRLSAHENAIVKEAGIMDFFHNIGTRRGRALTAWEARYPKIVQKLRENTLLVLSKSQTVYETVLASLEDLASARASRNVDQYMAATKNITHTLEKYDVVFREFYNKDVKPWMDKTDVFKEETESGIKPAVVGIPGVGIDEGPVGQRPEQLAQRPVLEMPAIPVANAPAAPAAGDNGPPTQPAGPPAHVPAAAVVPAASPAVVNPAAAKAQEAAAAAIKANEKFKAMKTKAHASFYNSLESMSGESPAILASYINKYARSIQSTDPETSIKLFGISKAIRS